MSLADLHCTSARDGLTSFALYSHYPVSCTGDASAFRCSEELIYAMKGKSTKMDLE